MNPKSYRILAKPLSARVKCPVCHEEVYSRGGIHPQCAVRQSDPPKSKKPPGAAPSPDVPEGPSADHPLDLMSPPDLPVV